MEEFISDWFIPMDFGNDAPEEMPDGEDMAGKHGEVAESVDAPLDNRNANLRCGELGNSSQCKSGLLHKLVLERGYESIQLQMDISVMRIRIVSPNGIM